MHNDNPPSPYAPPTSSLVASPEEVGAPSIDEALARGYDFSLGEVLNQAWSRVKGTKGILFCGLLVYGVASNLITLLLGLVLGVPLSGEPGLYAILAQMLASLIAVALCYPLLAGVTMVGVRRAADQPVSFGIIFGYFGKALPLAITAILMFLLVYLGLFLLIIPGIYLSIAYLLAIPLVVERNLSPWQALEASRKAISQHWFKVAGLMLLLGIIMLLSALPFGIGVIWSLPLAFISVGVLYRRIFGALPSPH
jgi:hypothetical protein